MRSIAKKEWQQFFSSLSGYLAIILFLLLNGLFLFVLKDSNIFDYGYATLDRFFELAPWVLIFLVPAITMRTFSDEFRTGTFELLQTRPLSGWDIVGGKFLATLLVLLVVILPTLVYVVTIKQLSATGFIDVGGIAGSYIGLFFLAATFAAIGLFCSSLTANPVIAFLLAAFVCLLAYFGFGALSRLPLFEGGADYYIDLLGIHFHYQSMSRGLLDSRDLVYFLSLIFLGLFLTEQVIRRK